MAIIVPASSLQNKSVVPRLLSYQELDILHALRGFCAFYVVVYHAKFLLWSGGTEYLRVSPGLVGAHRNTWPSLAICLVRQAMKW